MFIYVFSEADRDKMVAEGFTYVCEDHGAKAWVFLTDEGGSREIPPGVQKVVTSRLTFNGAI